jgi:O-antigen/teichoic acid export membrane protein
VSGGPLGDVAVSALSQAVRGGAVSVVGVATAAALQFGLLLAVTHGLPQDSAGAFLEAVALFAIVSSCAELGADTGLVRSVAIGTSKHDVGGVAASLRAALPTVTAFGITVSAAVVLASNFIARFIASERVVSLQAIYLREVGAAIAFATVGAVLLAGVRGFGLMSTYVAIQNMVLPGLRIVAVSSTLALGLNARWLGTAWAAPLVVYVVACAWALSRAYRRFCADVGYREGRGTTSASTTYRTFWRFSGPAGLSGALSSVLLSADVLLVGALASSKQAAVYAALSRLVLLGTTALEAAGMAFAPYLAKFASDDDPDRLERFVRGATVYVVAFGWPFYLVAASYSSVLLHVFGSEYTIGASAMSVLALAGLVNVSTGNSTLLLMMSGHSRVQLGNAATVTGLNLGLNVLLIPRFGMTGAAVAWACSILMNNVLAVWEGKRLLGVLPFSRTATCVAGLALGCFAMPPLAWRLATHESSYVASATIVAISLFAYATFLVMADRRRASRRRRALG